MAIVPNVVLLKFWRPSIATTMEVSSAHCTLLTFPGPAILPSNVAMEICRKLFMALILYLMQVDEPAPADFDSAEPKSSVQEGAVPEQSAPAQETSAAAMDESASAEPLAASVPSTDSSASAESASASDVATEPSSGAVDSSSERTPAPDEGADQGAAVNEATTEVKPVVSNAASKQAPSPDTSSAEPNSLSSETASSSAEEPALPDDLLAVLELQAEVLKSQVHTLQAGKRAHAALAKSAANEQGSSSSSLSAGSENGSSSSSSKRSSAASDPLAFAPLVNPTRDESTLCKLLDEQGGLGSRAGVGDFVDLCVRTTSTIRRATLIAVRAGDRVGRGGIFLHSCYLVVWLSLSF